MKTVSLLEVTRDALGSEQPAVGGELAIAGIRYRVLQVKPRKHRPSKWRRATAGDKPEKWQLLVETCD